MRTARASVQILYFQRDLRIAQLVPKLATFTDENPYAFGLLPMENRKIDITIPPMVNFTLRIMSPSSLVRSR